VADAVLAGVSVPPPMVGVAGGVAQASNKQDNPNQTMICFILISLPQF
jgi:hypothetical protein